MGSVLRRMLKKCLLHTLVKIAVNDNRHEMNSLILTQPEKKTSNSCFKGSLRCLSN